MNENFMKAFPLSHYALGGSLRPHISEIISSHHHREKKNEGPNPKRHARETKTNEESNIKCFKAISTAVLI